MAMTAALVAGCSSGDDWTESRPEPRAVGALGPGFLPSATPSPEATIIPRPGSWDDVHPPEGYRVVLLTAGDDRPTTVLVKAVRAWAEAEKVDLRTVEVTDARKVLDHIDEAIAMSPDLVISAGNDLVDPLTTVTPHHLEQPFLVVGAELAEPTGNVTAAGWTGASYRGKGLGASSAFDPETFTPERATRAVRAGVAAVLNDLSGIVIWLD